MLIYVTFSVVYVVIIHWLHIICWSVPLSSVLLIVLCFPFACFQRLVLHRKQCIIPSNKAAIATPKTMLVGHHYMKLVHAAILMLLKFF